jgi:hypothetical protein
MRRDFGALGVAESRSSLLDHSRRTTAFMPRISYVFSEQHSKIPICSFTKNRFQVGLTSLF